MYQAASVAWQSYHWLRRNHPQALHHREAFEVAMARASKFGAWEASQHPGVFAHWLPAYPWWPLQLWHPSINCRDQPAMVLQLTLWVVVTTVVVNGITMAPLM